MRFKPLLIFILLACLDLSLSGCWLIYKPDIKQGNILSTKKVSAIHSGMTREEVVALLGNPILVNVFADNQMIYVYTIQPGHGEFQAQQLRIYFVHNRVVKYTSSVH